VRRWFSADALAKYVVTIAAASILVITAALVWELWTSSDAARERFGWEFLFGRAWDPVNEQFGALPFIYGTVVTSLLALAIAVPVGLGAAIFLAELAPPRLSDGLTFVIELLAAVPSVIYGLVGIFVGVPFLREYVAPARSWCCRSSCR
jgi:phosphate transport system permease protein